MLNLEKSSSKISKQKIALRKLPLQPDEIIIRFGAANLYHGPGLSDGGKLMLTNQRLIFSAHGVNLNPHLLWELDVQQIIEVKIARNLFLSQTIVITDQSKQETDFIVYRGKTWLREIEQVIGKGL